MNSLEIWYTVGGGSHPRPPKGTNLKTKLPRKTPKNQWGLYKRRNWKNRSKLPEDQIVGRFYQMADCWSQGL